MFSRIFFSRPRDAKERDPLPSAQPSPPGRSPSPPLTESASLSASVATGPQGSPRRVPLPAFRTPSPALDGEADRATLQALFSACPAKTLHQYMLSRLPTASPSELRGLATFFAAFEPPQHLHCVRCHKYYYEAENDDHSCTMPHDDESAEVEHVGYAKRGAAGAYETRWDCCGRVVDGDGDLGPPSGWCYEGRHTIDRKRARYRTDSTPTKDLLQSCEDRGCHRKRARAEAAAAAAPVPDDARSTRSVRSVRSAASHRSRARDNNAADASKPKPAKKRAPRKRAPKPAAGDGQAAQEQDAVSSPKKRLKTAA